MHTISACSASTGCDARTSLRRARSPTARRAAQAVRHDAWHARVASLAPLFDAVAAETGRPTDAAAVAAVWNKLLPGMLTKYDAPHTLGAIMPRPCLVLNNAADPRCPREGLEWFLRPKPRALARRAASIPLRAPTTAPPGDSAHAPLPG